MPENNLFDLGKSWTLVDAAKIGDEKSLSGLIKDKSIQTAFKLFALINSAEQGHITCLNMVLEQLESEKIDDHTFYHNSGTALLKAAEKGKELCLSALLDKRGHFITNQSKNEALIKAVMGHHAKCTAELLAKCRNDISKEYKKAALFNAVQTNKKLFVAILLNQCGDDINMIEIGSMTQTAADLKHVGCFSLLLKHQLNHLKKEEIFDKTPADLLVKNWTLLFSQKINSHSYQKNTNYQLYDEFNLQTLSKPSKPSIP